jgi:hypothetical protein
MAAARDRRARPRREPWRSAVTSGEQKGADPPESRQTAATRGKEHRTGLSGSTVPVGRRELEVILLPRVGSWEEFSLRLQRGLDRVHLLPFAGRATCGLGWRRWSWPSCLGREGFARRGVPQWVMVGMSIEKLHLVVQRRSCSSPGFSSTSRSDTVNPVSSLQRPGVLHLIAPRSSVSENH